MEPKNEQKPVVNQIPAGATMSHHQSGVGPQGRPILSFGEAVKICFKKYFDFTGRARRSEYWWFVLFICLVRMVCSFIDSILIFAVDMKFMDAASCVLLFIPSMAVVFRRLHDIGRSGWWMGVAYILLAAAGIALAVTSSLGISDFFDEMRLIDAFLLLKPVVYIPLLASLVVSIICLVFSFIDSQKHTNKYGPSPKYQ